MTTLNIATAVLTTRRGQDDSRCEPIAAIDANAPPVRSVQVVPSGEPCSLNTTVGAVPPVNAHRCTWKYAPAVDDPPKVELSSSGPAPVAPASRFFGDSRMTPVLKSPRASISRSYSTASLVFAISEKSEMVEGCMVIGASCAKPSTAYQKFTGEVRPNRCPMIAPILPLRIAATPLSLALPSIWPARLFLTRSPKPSAVILSALRPWFRSLPWAVNRYSSMPQWVLKPTEESGSALMSMATVTSPCCWVRPTKRNELSWVSCESTAPVGRTSCHRDTHRCLWESDPAEHPNPAHTRSPRRI